MSNDLPPALRRYVEVKTLHPDCVLFYRIGDFYEMFFSDAVTFSSILGLHLTKRGSQKGEDIPMCGVPASSCDVYVGKLVKQGYKVAICEQVETIEEAKKRGSSAVVKRDVVRVITPGTLIEDNLLSSHTPNILLSLVKTGKDLGLAWVDLSTRKSSVSLIESHKLESFLLRISPSEILVSDGLYDSFRVLLESSGATITRRPDNLFALSSAAEEIKRFYQVIDIGFIAFACDAQVIAFGVLLSYVRDTQIGQTVSIDIPNCHSDNEYLEMDPSTMRGLEILQSQTPSDKSSLLYVIDRAVTSPGRRLLREYISAPLLSVSEVNKRLDKVEFFFMQSDLRAKLLDIMSGLPDAERALSRIVIGRAEPSDCLALLSCMKSSMLIAKQLLPFVSDSTYVKNLCEEIVPQDELIGLLSKAFIPSACKKVDGDFLRYDYHPNLSELHELSRNAGSLLQELCNQYRKSTGIAKLKIDKNNLIGFYVEVPKSAMVLDPEVFKYRQALINAIRYTTHDLQELEVKVVRAKENYRTVELELFTEICSRIAAEEKILRQIIRCITELDVFLSFAELAKENNYVRPVVNDSDSLKIIGGRHPFVEKTQTFVPNDSSFDLNERICLLTGPNMAGKSTYLRQTALLVIMTQVGSFIPADSATIGVVDKLFSRIGASDNIAKGRSTFMVEMLETANIVRNATNRSLVILDEVGRGTSTRDGIAIAQAVLEYLHDVVGCKTIFATHYNELCKLEDSHPMIKCYCTKIEKWQNDIYLMYKIIPGKEDNSYGIHAAMVSGVPRAIIDRARELAEQSL